MTGPRRCSYQTSHPVDPLRQPDPASIPRASWRSEIKGASGVNLIAGLWLAASPFILGYQQMDPVWTQAVAGAAIALLGLVRIASGAWKSWMSWANASLGGGICLVAITVADSAAAHWNGIGLGALVLVLGVLSASATEGALRSSEEAQAASAGDPRRRRSQLWARTDSEIARSERPST